MRQVELVGLRHVPAHAAESSVALQGCLAGAQKSVLALRRQAHRTIHLIYCVHAVRRHEAGTRRGRRHILLHKIGLTISQQGLVSSDACGGAQMTRGSSRRLRGAVLGRKLLLIRALRVYSVAANVQVVHTAHHHLAGVAECSAAAATGGTHTEALAGRRLGRRVGNACRSRWADQSARGRRIHIIVSHAGRGGLSCSRQALSVKIVGVIRAKSVALEGVLTRQ